MLFKPLATDLKTTPVARRGARRAAAACFVLLCVLAGGMAAAHGASPWFPLKAAAVYGLAIAVLLQALDADAQLARFGPANGVTLLRLSLVALLAAVIGEPVGDASRAAWTVVVIATIAALLDAADGPLARATGMASAFGARFDMETDALLTLVLSLLLMHFGKVGAWILAAGLMRYAFVLAMRAWPWLQAPLAPSLRRKTICVVQITSLIVCLAPIVPRPWTTLIAAASLALLAASFGADIMLLARRRQPCAVGGA
ncbi:CDP-alcohol phosphatidyltransferase family protein [Variovorax sp. PBL-E5]|uniref:CDP-alcohol phosphatidyltransferase family protein n=1 Tax=Variovorax sp. PBL-E5 TaxID=434014 RepID=UPI0013161BFE|nr:CDP-alcohol phosphatidyltransferase family protein [Variovorax sp. PBL-E5]VTU34053.1 CDP-diacylglycerol--glycerol-3-phosphate 3-phosphatidyltransferase [Variovorax sp. PBL-E5]